MLVLTRKPLETIHIGSDVVITVVELRTGQVRIGIEAPRQTEVVRGELLDETNACAGTATVR